MDYVLFGHMRWLAVAMLGAMLVSDASAWQRDWRPIYVNDDPENVSKTDILNAPNGNVDNFKILLVEGNRVFFGLRDHLFYFQFRPHSHLAMIYWPSDDTARINCYNSGRGNCYNYIRVVVFNDSERAYYICGTNAYAPKCGYFTYNSLTGFSNSTYNESGIGISPFNPDYNSTAIYTDGKLFTATVSDANERYPMISLKYNNTEKLWTDFHQSIFLNEAQFVSSDHKNDKVFFFFREVAVENINCGKAIFSRVARVCKNDQGMYNNSNRFSSYFKARLNCSIPGEYPFYFDNIESATEFGQGNHRPTGNSSNRADMVYGVFNTPDNAISGSAVCAFRYSDIEETFSGMFKYQDSYLHNWQPVRWDDRNNPHPALCDVPRSQVWDDSTRFPMTHPLMNKAVPAAGGMPLLVLTGSRSKFTQIAVHWQVLAVDGKYYDVMFVGTDDGRIIKAINNGINNVESVVIEDIQVLDVGDPVVSLKVLSHPTSNASLLLVVSRRKVVTIPVHRCGRATTSRECVAQRDPYCVWNIIRGCVSRMMEQSRLKRSDKVRPLEKVKEIDDKPDERLVSASTTTQEACLAIKIVIVAVIVTFIGSLILGFFIGFTFQACRYARQRDNVFHTDHSNKTPKQINDVANPGKINSMEAKPMTKPNKVYV